MSPTAGPPQPTPELSGRTAVVGDRDDHRQLERIVTQRAQDGGNAVASTQYHDPSAHRGHLLDGDRLGKVAWLIDVQATRASKVVGEQL